MLPYWFIGSFFIHSFIVSVRYFSDIRDTRKNKLVSSASVTYSLDLSVSLCKDM